MKVKDMMLELNLCLGSSRPHYGREKWTSRTRKLHEQLLTVADILIQADFSATVDLRASEADNSSQDNHAVLLCMTVSYNFRHVELEIKNEDGEVTGAELYYTCDTDHWNFFGPSGGKSKKNDHIFYNSCKKHVIKYYKKYLAEKGIELHRYPCDKSSLAVARSRRFGGRCRCSRRNEAASSGGTVMVWSKVPKDRKDLRKNDRARIDRVLLGATHSLIFRVRRPRKAGPA